MLGIECLLLIPFILKFKQLDEGARWMFAYLICSIIFAAGSTWVGYLWGNNMWFFSIMYMVQFVILSVFYSIMIKNKVIRTFIKIMILPALIICVIDLLRLEGHAHFNSIFASVRNVVLLAYGIAFFLQMLRDDNLIKQSVFINSLPSFWFNAGLFIYLCGTVMKNISYNYFSIHTDSAIDNSVLTLSFIAGIIQLILIFIGLMKVKKTTNGYS